MKKIYLIATYLALSFAKESVAQIVNVAKSESISISALLERVEMLELQARSLRARVAYKFATLDCNTGKLDEFLALDSSLIFFASCAKIEPYLEGHRLTIRIGNPSNFVFSQVKGALNYGKDYLDSSTKRIDFSPVESIRTGSWTSFTVTANPSKPEDMRYLRLELGASVMHPGN